MSLKCVAKSILYDIDYWNISITKRKVIRKLCEKQIPKAILFDDNDLNICPVCKEHVETDDKYCWNCGQGIILNISKED
jgi:hypothetical protein